jgi:hypothetical protein
LFRVDSLRTNAYASVFICFPQHVLLIQHCVSAALHIVPDRLHSLLLDAKSCTVSSAVCLLCIVLWRAYHVSSSHQWREEVLVLLYMNPHRHPHFLLFSEVPDRTTFILMSHKC